ncbi:sensor histidine kinase [Halalkalibacter oceani]|uniref:sensor histidine kinase n=1 Tax=Halalkalibacter oceani TaxID=1653776 RepID=UPI00339987E0
MVTKLSLKIGLLFFFFILLIESFLFVTLYFTLVNERVEEIVGNLLARGNTHREVLEDSFEQTTLEHVGMMESASDFIVIITDESGNVIVHSDPIAPEIDEILRHTDLTNIPIEGKVLEERWNEKDYIATDSPITINGEHSGHVFMFADTNQIKKIVDHLRRQFIVVGLIVIATTILTIFVLSKLITLPLIRMKEATEQLSQGHNKVLLNIERKDELGELANAITRLSTDLARLKSARNEFLASISHELRTPLTYLKGYADIVSRPETSEANKQEYIAIIREESEYLSALVKRLFELAQLDKNQFIIEKQQVKLADLLRTIIDLIRPMFSAKDVQLVLLCKEDITACIDPERFQQVLLNVLDNAKKHSPAKTQVTVKVTCTAQHITIIVKDQGEGIPSEELPYVFERLYRVEKSRSRQSGGMGLGLAIAKEIIESHGGMMKIDSVSGEGTCVSIKLERGEGCA